MYQANILLNLQPVSVKLCDFGLARSLVGLDGKGNNASISNEHSLLASKPMQRTLTKHVVTRWYRPPEIIFCDNRYSFAVDLWSIGCIFAGEHTNTAFAIIILIYLFVLIILNYLRNVEYDEGQLSGSFSSCLPTPSHKSV